MNSRYRESGYSTAVWPLPPQLQLTLLCESEGEVRELAILWLRWPHRLCYHAEIAVMRCSCQVSWNVEFKGRIWLNQLYNLNSFQTEWMFVSAKVSSLVGKPEGKRPMGRPRRRWVDNIRMISSRWDVGIWTGLGWPRIETGGGRLWVR